jgi:hypothetical protein
LKKAAVFLLFLFLTGGFLSAQMYRETRIYVPPIDGVGFIDDLAWFYRQITTEITSLHRTLGRARRFSDYVITGKLMPIEGEAIELLPGSENDEYVLYVELVDNATEEAIGNQYLTYLYPDENTANALSVIIYNMLSPIPDSIEIYSEEDNWRNKFIYLTGSFAWTPTVFRSKYQSFNGNSVSGGIMADVHFLSFLGLKAGGEVLQDWVAVYDDKSYSGMVLEFPVALMYVLRLRDNFLLEPYIGGTVNLPLFGDVSPFPVSWMAGIDIGVKAGIGILTFEPRFSMDFGQSTVGTKEDNTKYYRYKVHVGVGYKVGFIQRKN